MQCNQCGKRCKGPLCTLCYNNHVRYEHLRDKLDVIEDLVMSMNARLLLERSDG